jgi:hypothetical protein
MQSPFRLQKYNDLSAGPMMIVIIAPEQTLLIGDEQGIAE